MDLADDGAPFRRFQSETNPFSAWLCQWRNYNGNPASMPALFRILQHTEYLLGKFMGANQKSIIVSNTLPYVHSMKIIV